MKKIAHIKFQNIDSIPALIKDFLDEKINGFEDLNFNAKNIERAIFSEKAFFSLAKRQILVEALRHQHESASLSMLQIDHLNLLEDSQTFTITTGHQLNLFTGPHFFVLKILQTIKTARYLTGKFPDYNFVPIFWMASEDHDFEEINHFSTKNSYYEIKGKSGGAVGKVKTDDLYFIDEFQKEFEDHVFGTELIMLIKKAYKKGQTLAQATRILVQDLFSKYGLLIIDGDDLRLKKEISVIFRDELLNSSLAKHTEDTVAFLKKNYGKVQVNPRKINLFHLSETRNRIDRVGENFKLADTEQSFSSSEILEELTNNPENFSPNALMRPVYQEFILPNLVYIGGNAEIMYWLELKDYFKYVGIPFPVLVPRNSALFLTEKEVKKISNFGLKPEDFVDGFPELTKRILLSNHPIAKTLNEGEKKVNDIFEAISKAAVLTDKTFENLVKAEQTRQLKSFKKMQKRLLKAERIKESEKLSRLQELFLEIHPGGSWQERVYNFSVFYADLGRDWLQNCYKEIDAETSELLIFRI